MGLVKVKIFKGLFYAVFPRCLISFLFKFLYLFSFYSLMIVFKVILCGFPPIVSFWEFDKAGALIFGIDLGVFGGKSGWGDFFLWFFLLERGKYLIT